MNKNSCGRIPQNFYKQFSLKEMKHNYPEDCDCASFQEITVWKRENTIAGGKPEKHHLSQMIKVDINNGKSC